MKPIAILYLFLLIYVSCSKDDQQNEVLLTEFDVISITEKYYENDSLDFEILYEIEHDQNNRISEIRGENLASNSTVLYENIYTESLGSVVEIQKRYESGNVSLVRKYIFEGDRIISIIDYGSWPISDLDILSTNNFNYDQNDKLNRINVDYVDNSLIFDYEKQFYWNNSQLDSFYQASAFNPVNFSTFKFYYSSLPNPMPLQYELFGINFDGGFGYSELLVDSIRSYDSRIDRIILTEYEYELDEIGRVKLKRNLNTNHETIYNYFMQ